MILEKKIVAHALFLIFLFSLGFSLFVNLPALQKEFLFSDEAIYYSMTQSLAHDFDLEYTKKDLIRYHQVFPSGPLGIFLKKGKGNKIFYAKSFAYSLFAAPFVKIFGTNGFLVFHSFLFFLILLMGYAFFSLWNNPLPSLSSVLTFLFASVAGVYFIWITPDFFNLFLVFSVLFLWLYKVKHKESAFEEQKTSTFQKFLLSGWTDYLASLLVGIAVFSKPPNIVLMGPLVLYSLSKKKFLKSILMITLFLFISGLFWGINYQVTGDWNYQGGERKTFYFKYPLEKEQRTFESTGLVMTSEGYGEKHLLPLKAILYNCFYYFWGRYAGIVWYFFPAFLSLVFFFSGKRRFYHWLIFGALAAEILIYITLMPDNYNGGGGALANRYFLNIYPLFLFLTPKKKTLKEIVGTWVIASIFLSQILVSPFLSSGFPATHVKKLPFKLLPVEYTLVNNFPTNTNPNAFRQEVGTLPNTGVLYFLDNNFHPRLKGSGFWTKGHHTAEIILVTPFPAQKLIFHLTSNPRRENEISVKVGRKGKTITLGSNQKGTLTFEPGKGFKMKSRHLYKIKIKADKGSIPFFEDESSRVKGFIGVFFELEIIPEE